MSAPRASAATAAHGSVSDEYTTAPAPAASTRTAKFGIAPCALGAVLTVSPPPVKATAPRASSIGARTIGKAPARSHRRNTVRSVRSGSTCSGRQTTVSGARRSRIIDWRTSDGRP